MRQLYEVWDIIPGRKVDATVEAVIDDWEGFRVLLRDYATNRMLRIQFESHIAYQNRDESDFLGEVSRSDGLGNGCFYKVKNSEYLLRFQADSFKDINLTHYAIFTEMDCIDVLAAMEPTLTLL